MDSVRGRLGVVAAGISAAETDALLDEVAAHTPTGSRHAGRRTGPDRPVRQSTRLRDLPRSPRVALVRVTPLVHQYPLNDKLYYPSTPPAPSSACPSRSTWGPGPRVRSACQHPQLLEDVLIDFKGLR